jgi:hypothetical protein
MNINELYAGIALGKWIAILLPVALLSGISLFLLAEYDSKAFSKLSNTAYKIYAASGIFSFAILCISTIGVVMWLVAVVLNLFMYG